MSCGRCLQLHEWLKRPEINEKRLNKILCSFIVMDQNFIILCGWLISPGQAQFQFSLERKYTNTNEQNVPECLESLFWLGNEVHWAKLASGD